MIANLVEGKNWLSSFLDIELIHIKCHKVMDVSWNISTMWYCTLEKTVLGAMWMENGYRQTEVLGTVSDSSNLVKFFWFSLCEPWDVPKTWRTKHWASVKSNTVVAISVNLKNTFKITIFGFREGVHVAGIPSDISSVIKPFTAKLHFIYFFLVAVVTVRALDCTYSIGCYINDTYQFQHIGSKEI